MQKGPPKKSKSTSCTSCQRRKIKCDRTYPCSSCVRFSQTCQFENPPKKTPVQRNSEVQVQEQLQALKAKLAQLERSLVANPEGSSALENSTNKFLSTLYATTDQAFNLQTSAGNSKQYIAGWMSQIADLDLTSDEDDYFCIYEQYDTVFDSGQERRFYGPFTWVAFLSGDMFSNRFNVLWRNRAMQIKGQIMTASSEPHQTFSKRFAWSSGEEAFHSVKDEVAQALRDKKSKLNKTHKSLGHTFNESELDPELELSNKVKSLLPSQNVIWLHLDRYFGLLYPLLPFLDEADYRRVIARILNGRHMVEQKAPDLVLDTRLDFAHLGILLIILRLSFLSLFTNMNDINEDLLNSDHDPGARYLMNNPISYDCVSVAESCLNQFNLLKSANITLIQFVTFYKAYYFYGPEFADILDDTGGSTMTSVLMDMAYSIGLHRDPASFANYSERQANLHRKLWYQICTFDFTGSLASGNPPSFNKYIGDVREPDILVDVDTANTQDLAVDKVANVLMFRNHEVFQALDIFHKSVLDINKKFNIRHINQICNSVKDLLVSNDPAFQVFVQGLDSEVASFYLQTVELKYWFELVYSYTGLNYHYFTYLSKQGEYEKSMRCLTRLFVLLFDKTLPLLADVFSGIKRPMHGVSDMIITPSMQVLVVRTRLVLFVVIIRVKILRARVPASEYLGEFEKLLRQANTLYNNINNILSNKYYYSWKTSKFNKHAFEMIDSLNLGELYDDYDFSHSYGFSEANVQRLSHILRQALVRVRSPALVAQEHTPDNDELWEVVTAMTQKVSVEPDLDQFVASFLS